MSYPAITLPDGIVLVLLLAFGAWGAWRGGLRQLLTFLVLLAAFPLASRFAPGLSDGVEKVVTVPSGDRLPIAWAAAFAGVLVAGGVLLAVLDPVWQRLRIRGAVDRWLGGILGLLQGVLLASVLVCAVLLVSPVGARAAGIRSLSESTAARGSIAVVRTVGRVLGLPEEVAGRVRRLAAE